MKAQRKGAEKGSLMDRIDCKINIYKEKIPGNGEDAYVFSQNCRAALIGVFDGCGGSGAKRLAKFQGKTGAYLASRIVSGTILDWFFAHCECWPADPEVSVKQEIMDQMKRCYNAVGEQSKLVSPMVKVFPTTAAFAVCREENEKIQVDYFWAGDSRIYLLDSDGLAQLSVDDLSVPDAMQNLYDDGVMTNVVNMSSSFTIHHGCTVLSKPGIVFSSTDGCFGYVSTPMEFEYMLIQSMLSSQSAAEWERHLSKMFESVAGDDYTLCGVALDYGSFDRIKASLIERGNTLFRNYISRIGGKSKEEKTQLWGRYRENYYRLQGRKIDQR